MDIQSKKFDFFFLSYFLIIKIMSNSTNSTKTQVHTPKIYFKFSPLTPEQALNEISTYTEDFDPKYNLTQEFQDNLTQSINSRDTTFRGFLDVSSYHPDIIKQVIGKGGCYFHLTTTNTKIEFIWHDRAQNRFFFWGTKFPLIKAMNIILHRIILVSQRNSLVSQKNA